MNAVQESIQNLWQETRELNLGAPPRIDHLPTPPSPLTFLRDFISPNKPCLISSATHHWPALSSWGSTSYLRRILSSSPVTLHLTPTGKADALTPHPSSPSSLCFASSYIQQLNFPEALDIVQGSSGGKVGYLQQQNDCFRSEYAALKGDCEEHVPWASEALGCLPEAVNLWVGNDMSETSFHKDHYENLYAVISGEKRFLLLPPTDVHRMYIQEYPAAAYHYHEDSGEFSLELEDPVRFVPWCSVDPYPSTTQKQKQKDMFPLYFNGPKPFEVTVKAGQMLYLPSMWFHHVRQKPDDSGLTIAINYWYDMRFDIKYAYFNFLQSITYSSPEDVIFSQIRNVTYSPSGPACNSEDESDITPHNSVSDGSDAEKDKDGVISNIACLSVSEARSSRLS